MACEDSLGKGSGMTTSPVRAMVFGAMMAAMTAVFYAIALVLPIPVHLPLPITLAYLRHGLRAAILAAVLGWLVSALFFGWFSALSLLVPFAIAPGLTMGWAISHRRTATQAGLATGLSAFFAFLLTSVVMLLVAGINPVDQLAQAQQQALQQVQERLSGMPADQQATLAEQLETMARMLPTLVPLILGMAMALQSVFSYQLAAWIFPRLGHPLEPFPPMRRWTMPREFMWVYPSAVLLSFLPNLPDALEKLTLLAIVSSQFLYMIQGMGIASWWLEEKAMLSRRAAAWGAAIAALFPYTGQIVVLAGIVDLAWDFRRLRPRGTNGAGR